MGDAVAYGVALGLLAREVRGESGGALTVRPVSDPAGGIAAEVYLAQGTPRTQRAFVMRMLRRMPALFHDRRLSAAYRDAHPREPRSSDVFGTLAGLDRIRARRGLVRFADDPQNADILHTTEAA